MAERGWWKHANERKAAERNVEKGGGRTKNPVAPTAESLFLWIFEHAPINSNVHDERVARREVVVRLPSIGSPVGLAGFLPKGWMCTRYPRGRGSGARVRPSSSKVKRGRYGCGCRTSRNHRKPVAQPLPDPPLCVADSRAPWPTQSNDSSTPSWNIGMFALVRVTVRVIRSPISARIRILVWTTRRKGLEAVYRKDFWIVYNMKSMVVGKC